MPDQTPETRPMACPICGHDVVTTRALPLEVYAQDGTPMHRIPEAIFCTCQTCGAGFYEDGWEHLPHVPITPQASAPPLYDVDC